MSRSSGGQAQPVQGNQRSQSSFNNPMPIPNGQSNSGGRQRNGSLLNGQFDTGRSPPHHQGLSGKKDTKHVPCKFFRQGQCQAGNSCPFSHSIDPMSHQAPCKYFMKGNCKFGAKCALAHYLPNGRRVRQEDLQYGTNGAPENVPQYQYSEPPLEEQYYAPSANSQQFPDIPFLEDEYDVNPDRYGFAFRNGNAYDVPIGSPPTSQFGSPPNNFLSPQRRWPSALEAPLPASYTNSVPFYASRGHVSGSVPDRFGLASPQSSTISQQLPGSPPTRDTFTHAPIQSSALKATPLDASPAHVETSLGERMLHSERNALRFKAPMFSASVPVRDFDQRFGAELESDLPFLPSDLHDEVLTPGEKARRLSRPEQELSSSHKDNSAGLAIPRRSSNVVGSPPAAGSPSRFRAIFEKQEREKTSTVGQVGSPLRESWMLNGNSSISERQSMQWGGISQQMARLELNRSDSTESNNGLRPNGMRNGYARQISSPGLHSRRIDEEGDPPTFFPMDDESRQARGININQNNRPVFGGFQQ